MGARRFATRDRGVAGLLLSILIGLLGAGVAGAQTSPWAPEIRMTRDVGTSARALGMGQAYLAVSDDAGGLRYNPAGLARVQRIEFSGTLTHLDRDLETSYYATEMQTSLGRTRVSSLGFIYPFPTYRGSMVIGVGYAVPWPLDREYARRELAGEASAVPFVEEILEEGQLGEWSFAYAVDVTPTLSLGLRASYLRGNRFEDWVYQDDAFDPAVENDIHDVTDIDVEGLTASFGAMSQLSERLRLGFVFDLPRWLWLEGAVKDEVYQEEFRVDEKMTLPFSAGIGAAYTLNRLLIAADARYADWTQIDYDGPLRYFDGQRREYAYQGTWDLHLGAEYLLDLTPLAGLRLRAGLAYQPLPYRILFERLTDEATPVYAEADVDPERLTYTAGIGLLLEQSLTIDAALARGRMERTGLNLAEDETETRFLLTAAFRLD